MARAQNSTKPNSHASFSKMIGARLRDLAVMSVFTQQPAYLLALVTDLG